MTQALGLKVLFPIDITEPHPEYIDQLKAILPIKDISLVFLYVREELPVYEGTLGSMAEFTTDFANQLEVKAKSVLGEIVDKLKPECANVSFQIVSGPATLMIDKVAKDESFDLIVMNASNHSKAEKFLLGSTCERVVKHSPVSVLVLRAAGTAKPLTNVVFGIDGSTASFAAISEAVCLFGLNSGASKVTVVNVVHITPVLKYVSPVEFVASVEDNLMMSGETSLAEAKTLLDGFGVKNVENKLRDGDPVTEILNVASDCKAELVVVGGQGRSALEHLVVGSVSGKLAAHAKSSILVCKAKK